MASDEIYSQISDAEAALFRGDYDRLPALAQMIGQAIVVADPDDLNTINARMTRLQDLTRAALSGVHSGRQRVAELAVVQSGAPAYGPDGKRSSNPAPTTRFESRT